MSSSVVPSLARPLVVFDFDGTIVDSLDLVVTQYNRIAPRFRTKPVQRSELPRLRRMKANAAMREHDISFWKLPLLVTAMRRAMHAHLDSLQPFAGMLDALQRLHAAGLRCSVLSTNSSANIRRFLARHDLHLFEHVAGGASMFGKARALRKLIREVRTAPEHVAYVGDEVRDVEAARSAGVRSIAVSWGYADRETLLQHQPSHLVDSPRDLVALLTG